MRPVNHEGTPEERLMRLECAYDELLQHAVTHQQLDKSDTYLVGAIEEVNRRLDKLQDANLAPVLESSALLVELRRIAKAIETLNYNLDGVQGRLTDGGWAIRTLPFGVS